MYDTRRQSHLRSNRNIPTTHIELDESIKAQNVGTKMPSKSPTKHSASMHTIYVIAL